jgi:hypothetical protein
MIDWWHDAHAAIVDLGLYRSDLDRMAEETPVTYREGMRDVIASCERQRIPILVFSAGVAGTFSLCAFLFSAAKSFYIVQLSNIQILLKPCCARTDCTRSTRTLFQIA